MQRDNAIKQAKTGGPSGARSRDLRIKRPESSTPLQLGNSSAGITRVFFREPTVHRHPPLPRKNRARATLYWPVLT